MHAVYWYLLIPTCGLSLLTLWFRPPVVGVGVGVHTATGTATTGITATAATASAGLALVACAFPVMSMVFLVWWEQVNS